MIKNNSHLQNFKKPYKVKFSDNTSYPLSVESQIKTINRWGDMSISKGGHSEATRLFDPTSSY